MGFGKNLTTLGEPPISTMIQGLKGVRAAGFGKLMLLLLLVPIAGFGTWAYGCYVWYYQMPPMDPGGAYCFECKKVTYLADRVFETTSPIGDGSQLVTFADVGVCQRCLSQVYPDRGLFASMHFFAAISCLISCFLFGATLLWVIFQNRASNRARASFDKG